MIKVLKAGFFTTIQDKGRKGFASFGVPISGVMDAYAADMANSLINNSLEDAVIEITLGGCEFQFTKKTQICISGGDFSPKLNGEPISLNTRVLIARNDIISFGKLVYGIRCYLAVRGGIQTEQKLNSRSFYKSITQNVYLKKGDTLPILEFQNDLTKAYTSIRINENRFKTEQLICFKGPEFDLLNTNQKEMIFSKKFTISNDNNRMGYRLNEIINNKLLQILTSAVLPGTVQLTPSGKLIVLMRDCQVTGGYPRILQLTEESTSILAQKSTNSVVKFVKK